MRSIAPSASAQANSMAAAGVNPGRSATMLACSTRRNLIAANARPPRWICSSSSISAAVPMSRTREHSSFGAARISIDCFGLPVNSAACAARRRNPPDAWSRSTADCDKARSAPVKTTVVAANGAVAEAKRISSCKVMPWYPRCFDRQRRPRLVDAAGADRSECALGRSGFATGPGKSSCVGVSCA